MLDATKSQAQLLRLYRQGKPKAGKPLLSCFNKRFQILAKIRPRKKRLVEM